MERVVRHWTRLPREVDAYYLKHLGVQSQVTWGPRQMIYYLIKYLATMNAGRTLKHDAH